MVSNTQNRSNNKNSSIQQKRWLSYTTLYILNAAIVLPGILFIIAYQNKGIAAGVNSAAIAFLPLVPVFWFGVLVYIIDLIVLLRYILIKTVHREFIRAKVWLAIPLFLVMASALYWGAVSLNKSDQTKPLPLMSKADVLLLINNCAAIGFEKDTTHKYGEEPSGNVIHFFPDQETLGKLLPGKLYTEYTSVNNWQSIVSAANATQAKCGYAGPIYSGN